jgi:hypothetical protein
VPLDRAVDLACHEAIPGTTSTTHSEQALVHERGWVEISMYRSSAASLIAEGTTNFGIDMALPPAERVAFERDSLFPLAGLDTSLASPNAELRRIVLALNYGRNEVARHYLDGELDPAAARAAMRRYWLIPPEEAAKNLRFIDTYRAT